MLRFRKTALAFALSQILNLSVPAAMAATITVDTDSGGANDPNHCTLRDAITAANADAATGGCPAGAGADTIILPVNATITLTAPDNPDNGLPVVTSSITIEGNGTTINRDSGGSNFRIFNVQSSGSLELRNTIISGGTVNRGRGGGILTRSSAITLINSTVSGNTATYKGGGILVEDSIITLTNSMVSGNTGERGGGISALSSTITLTNSMVSGNLARQQYVDPEYGSLAMGGGISAYNSTVTITNSIVSGNSALTDCCGPGGINAVESTVNLTNSTVSGNSSSATGGAILIRARGTMNITNSTVSGNTATYNGGGLYVSDYSMINFSNSTISGNSAGHKGGGIYVIFGGGVTLTNSTVSGNSALNGEGGGIHVSSFLRQGSVLIQNSIIANNSGGDCVNNSGITPTAISNLIGDSGTNCGTPLLTGDPKLGPLANNGGPTQTHALLTGSPAIDVGDDTICATLPKNARGQSTDQRGQPRAGPTAGPRCDLGAYELQQEQGLVPIPTLGEWGQMATTALLMLLAWFGLRRRTPD